MALEVALCIGRTKFVRQRLNAGFHVFSVDKLILRSSTVIYDNNNNYYLLQKNSCKHL